MKGTVTTARRGDVDCSFAHLEKTLAERDRGLSDVAIEPMFANLWKDPRWLPFLRDVGKAPAQLAAVQFNVKLATWRRKRDQRTCGILATGPGADPSVPRCCPP